MMFAAAADRGLITANPFAAVRHRGGNPTERRHYVPVADAERLIEHAPNTTWRLLIALSRFAGLRVPSEALMLKWADVDWERGRFLVGEPKNENRAGRGMRAVPLFPLLWPHLEQAFQEAPDGAVFVFPADYRRRAAWLERLQPADHVLEDCPPGQARPLAPALAFDAGELPDRPGRRVPPGDGCQVAGEHAGHRPSPLRRCHRRRLRPGGPLAAAARCTSAAAST
jgi:hypothetical protein